MGPLVQPSNSFLAKRQLIDEGSAQSTPVDLNVTLDSNKLSMKTSDGKNLAPDITSSNKVQLKFETKEFVGEYFHYTGDLFLIYPSGKLARLNCSRV